jgi:hypothetical protein
MCPIIAGLSLLSTSKGSVYGGVVKLVDTLDSKSSWGNSVPVRVRPPLPFLNSSKSVRTVFQKIINQAIG